MSDTTFGTLINSYYTGITTLMGSGQTLEYVMGVHIVPKLEDVQFLDWSTTPPFIIIHWDDFSPEPDAMSGTAISYRFDYPVILSGFVEYHDENTGFLGDSTAGIYGTKDLYEDILSEYLDDTLSETTMSSTLINVSFARQGGEFLTGYHQVHITFEHLQLLRAT